jgi:N-acetylmuramoyl-L-alanine amidase/IPT/TIG domain
MARYLNAQWRPVPNENPGGMTAYTFLVMHIMQGTLGGTDSWFHNTTSRVSSHFGVGKDGTVYQWVDTADRAWAQAAGNPVGISIEHEGNVPDPLTPQQIAADSAILTWVHQTHGIPLQLTDDPLAGSGVCGHSTGALQKWGHPFWLGQAIMDQRQNIVDGATQLLSLPVVTGISPASGAAGGGDTVTVTGTGFAGATSVLFGSVAATNLNVASDTQLTVTSPPPNASGAVDVTVYPVKPSRIRRRPTSLPTAAELPATIPAGHRLHTYQAGDSSLGSGKSRDFSRRSGEARPAWQMTTRCSGSLAGWR